MWRRPSYPIISIFLSLLGLGSAWAAAPAVPTGLKVTPLGVNSFQVEWKDNSKNETGFELRVGLKSKNPPARFLLIPTLSATGTDKQTKLIITNPLPGKELNFQMTAYNGATGFEIFSNPTAVVTIKALSPTEFMPPSKLRAKRVDDSQIRLAWDDNATSEYGYQVFLKKGTGKWELYTITQPGTKFDFPFSGFDTEKTYSFRVRAFKENPVVFSPYSNVLTVTTKAFQAPSELVATPAGEGKFQFKWKDNSSIETGVDLEAKSGTGNFTRVLKADGSNFTKTGDIDGFALDTDYQFRLRVFRLVAGKETFSGYSNVFSVKSAPMTAPSDFTAERTNNTSVTLKWKDLSIYETGYDVQYRIVGTTDFSLGTISQQQSVVVSDLLPNKNYEFRIRGTTFFSSAKSAYTSLANVSTKDGIVSGLKPTILAGSNFLYAIQVSSPAKLTNLAVTGLPAGLVFNSATGTITGNLTTGGNYTVTITATFNDGTSTTRSLVLKSVSQSPVISQTFAAVSVAATVSKTVSVTGKFSDPDTISAARVNTTLGSFDIILFPDATPNTVSNFLDYIDDLRYDDTFFHRAPQNFVVQGGGYKHTAAGGFSRVATLPAVVNEPGLSNIRGTVAMAKLGGDPNSATSQFFVNLGNNTGPAPPAPPPLGLDYQNGGFTVFGRVPTSGMTVLDSINALPKSNYQNPTNPTDPLDLLDNVPMNAESAPATLDPMELVKITSVAAAPILSYQVLSQNTGVATASITGSDISITGVATGSTTVQVTATDLDGNTVNQNITVTVP